MENKILLKYVPIFVPVLNYKFVFKVWGLRFVGRKEDIDIILTFFMFLYL